MKISTIFQENENFKNPGAERIPLPPGRNLNTG